MYSHAAPNGAKDAATKQQTINIFVPNGTDQTAFQILE